MFIAIVFDIRPRSTRAQCALAVDCLAFLSEPVNVKRAGYKYFAPAEQRAGQQRMGISIVKPLQALACDRKEQPKG